ncbi:SDR family NAD(P)-dependent oxidoreductase [Sphingomonas sp. TREG-RG-20F-R18-01]|uniref:SDR family NAD(P)-dependent oxidoreductase n=1 Tax=Sphingomonas sp. TREG-RG-20F-R18-01 TaxID=2914982 RepID=UPI001F58B961
MNGARVSLIQADVSDVAALDRAIDRIAHDLGGLDVLVSVAGTAIVGRLRLTRTTLWTRPGVRS